MTVARLLLLLVLRLSLTLPVHPLCLIPLTMMPRQRSSTLQTTVDSTPLSLLEDADVYRPLVRFHQTSTEMHFGQLSSLLFLTTMSLDQAMLEYHLAMAT
jgi:hypothetical protein